MVDDSQISKSFAIIMDCDDTVAPQTTSRLIEYLGEDPEVFWPPINERAKEGWDVELLWMPEILKMAVKKGTPITKDLLEDAGKKLEYYPGIPSFYKDLKEWFDREKGTYNEGLSMKYFIISSGLEDLLTRSLLYDFVDEVYGCTFEFDQNDIAIAPKSSVTFTEKNSKYLYI